MFTHLTVKNEILLTDASSCVASLKKAILDFRVNISTDAGVPASQSVLGSAEFVSKAFS